MKAGRREEGGAQGPPLPWCGGHAGLGLTRQAGGGIDPLEQLPDAQLATLVGVAGKHQLAHLHLRGVPVALTVGHAVAVRVCGRLPGCAVGEHGGQALGSRRKVSSQQSLQVCQPPRSPRPPANRTQLQDWPAPSSPGSQTPGALWMPLLCPASFWPQIPC